MTEDPPPSRAQELLRISMQMLREVLDGADYSAVARRWQLSRSTVDRRVKALATILTNEVGVEGLHQSGAVHINRLREHRAALLRALERFQPEPAKSMRSARVLSADEVALGARRVRARAVWPCRDLVLYHLLFATGLRPLELARLSLDDYLLSTGDVRRESSVRAEVAINGRCRPLYFRHRQLDEAMSEYLQMRLDRGLGVGTPGHWRGLDPRQPLLVDAEGRPYPVTPNGHEGQRRYVCRALLELCRKMFRHAGIAGMSAQSARLTLMARMYERGADEAQVGQVLGIADLSAVRAQLARPRLDLALLLEDRS